MIRYYPMCLDPVSPLADAPLGGGMIATMYEEGVHFFRHLYESDEYKGKVPVFIEDWGKLDADDAYARVCEAVIDAGMAPYADVWAIIDTLDNDPENAKVNALADDMKEAFRRGLWEGYQDLMFDLDVPVVKD